MLSNSRNAICRMSPTLIEATWFYLICLSLCWLILPSYLHDGWFNNNWIMSLSPLSCMPLCCWVGQIRTPLHTLTFLYFVSHFKVHFPDFEKVEWLNKVQYHNILNSYVSWNLLKKVVALHFLCSLKAVLKSSIYTPTVPSWYYSRSHGLIRIN